MDQGVRVDQLHRAGQLGHLPRPPERAIGGDHQRRPQPLPGPLQAVGDGVRDLARALRPNPFAPLRQHGRHGLPGFLEQLLDVSD